MEYFKFIIYSFLAYVKRITPFLRKIIERGAIMYGQRIKELRIEKGLTQAEFAKILNTTQKNISKYELEKLDLSTDIIILICRNFNISADYILGLED